MTARAPLSYWEQQFNLRQVLPDFAEILDRMQVQSDAVRLSFDRWSTGPDPRQFVEVSGTPQPGQVLPVFIHGGYWRALEAERHRFVLPPLFEMCGAVANLEYRLLPDVSLPEIIEDAVAGLRLLAERIGAPLFVIGHSAGGHLAICGANALPDHVVGAVAISGIYDLTPLPWSFMHQEVGLTAADIEGCSPLFNWSRPSADHVLIAVGAQETPEFIRQAQVFRHQHGAEVFDIENAHHMQVLDVLADPNSALSATLKRRIIRAGDPGCGP